MMSRPQSPSTVVGVKGYESPSKGMQKNVIPTSPSGSTAAPSSTTVPPPKKQSVLLLLLLAGGVGVVGGFGLFFTMYQSQCARLLSSASQDYNSTLEKLHSVGERKTLARQQDLLDQQTAITAQHQDVLVRLSNAQKEQESTNAIVQHQKKEMQTMQRALQEADKAIRKAGDENIKIRERMQRQLDLARTMLQEKVDEVEDLKEKSDASEKCDTSGGTTVSDEMINMQSIIRRRESIQTISKFGLLPVVVMFLVKSPNQSAISFEVEFSHLHEMPHTIFTFLTLVEAGLYPETTLVRHGDRLEGGSPSTCVRKQAQSKLVRRMAELGYSMEPLLFTERSTHACQSGGFGVLHKGPGFAVYLQDAPEEFTCLGTLVAGQADVRNFPPGTKITIVDARIVKSGHDEL